MSVGFVESIRNARQSLNMDELGVVDDLCDAVRINVYKEEDGQHLELDVDRVTIVIEDDMVPRHLTAFKDLGDGDTVKLAFTLVGMKAPVDFAYDVEIVE